MLQVSSLLNFFPALFVKAHKPGVAKIISNSPKGILDNTYSHTWKLSLNKQLDNWELNVKGNPGEEFYCVRGTCLVTQGFD